MSEEYSPQIVPGTACAYADCACGDMCEEHCATDGCIEEDEFEDDDDIDENEPEAGDA